MSLPADILKNIISDYIEYDELINLIAHISVLKINPKRIRIEEIFDRNLGNTIKNIYVDKCLKKSEGWYSNNQISYQCNFRYGILNGPQYQWHSNGQLNLEENYKDGIRDGSRYCYYMNSELVRETCYKDNKILYDLYFLRNTIFI